MEINLDSYLKKLGKNVAKIRKRNSMTQYKLAKEIFTDQSNLARIEEGKVNPTVKTLVKISIVLKCDIKDLFEG
jgi:transcriptional regulator with XRE-family HTH domain